VILRNIIKHLDFDIEVGHDKIVYSNKEDETKTILIVQISYVPTNASPNPDVVRRPYSITVTKNNNKVVSIQNITFPNQPLIPIIKIGPNENYKIEIFGYDGTAEIFLIGSVMEEEGVNINP
jgi:hypothetical protein